MVVTFYSGSLVAFLTFPQYEFPVTNLENLLKKQSEFNWGFQQGSVIENYLETTEGDNYKVNLASLEHFYDCQYLGDS